ncbi:MAG TPA: hypothetical protein VMH00_17265 [Candidatus Limnocylindrales bacterium]|nr:hypothetical protein [Candidatus Limnocylindrales bacterium]
MSICANSSRKNLAAGDAECEDARTMLIRLLQVCREEFAKAAFATVRAYEAMREIDERTMEILVALLGRPK